MTGGARGIPAWNLDRIESFEHRLRGVADVHFILESHILGVRILSTAKRPHVHPVVERVSRPPSVEYVLISGVPSSQRLGGRSRGRWGVAVRFAFLWALFHRFGADVLGFVLRIARADRVEINVGEIPTLTVTACVKDFPANRAIPMILDRVIGSPREELGNVRPLVAVFRVRGEDNFVLLAGPGGLANAWIEMVVPPLPTLFANASRQKGCNLRPFAWPELLYVIAHDVILLG